MKKILAGVASVMAAAIVLTGCSANTKNFGATYFDKNASDSGVASVNERLTYDVYSFRDEDPRGNTDKFGKIAALNEKLTFNVSEQSSYVTTIKTSGDGEYYVFTSTLKVKGAYVYDTDKEYAVDDETVTTVEFKGIGSKFKPISVKRTATNVVPLSVAPTSENDFVRLAYTYTVDYGKNAVISVSADDEQSKDYFQAQTRKDTVIKKYDKKEFVENDILFTVFRNFDYTSGFSYSFNTIDAISQSLTSVTASTVSASTDKSPVTLLKMRDTRLYGRSVPAFNAVGIKFATTGRYARTFAYCYYANSVNWNGETAAEEKTEDGNQTRRVPALIAQPSIHNTGYLVFALKSAE